MIPTNHGFATFSGNVPVTPGPGHNEATVNRQYTWLDAKFSATSSNSSPRSWPARVEITPPMLFSVSARKVLTAPVSR